MIPRYYQLEAKQAVLDYEGDLGAMLVMATGSGKTRTAMLVVEEYLARGLRVLWVAERHELVVGAFETLASMGTWRQGYVGAGLGDDFDAQCIFAKKDSLIRPHRLDKLPEVDLMVIDECHHSSAASWKRLIERANPKKLMGLTATPDRADHHRLSDLWEIVYDYPMLRAQDEGFLLPLYAAVDKPPDLDLSKVPSNRKDYLPADLEESLIQSHIVEHTVEALSRAHIAERLPFRDSRVAFDPQKCDGILVYCVTIQQAALTVQALEAAEWNAALLHGETDPKERDRVIESFRKGELHVIVNVGILTEGTDLPWAQVVVMARPTTSWPLFMQICGRAVRRHGSQQHAFVLDLVGATEHHSIVSAAVLVDGVDCAESHDGRHHYLPLPSGEGRCQHCNDMVKCFRHKGGHRFESGQCACGAIQCEMSSDNTHHFIPWEPGIRMCVFCGMNSPEPLSGILGRVNPPILPVHWERLKMGEPEVWASHLGNVGILFNVRAAPDLWRPFWYAKGRLQPLSGSAVSPQMSRLLTQDVARRAQRVKGLYGNREKPAQLRQALKEAQYIARTAEVWKYR